MWVVLYWLQERPTYQHHEQQPCDEVNLLVKGAALVKWLAVTINFVEALIYHIEIIVIF